MSGLDNGINYVFDDEEIMMTYKLPFNPLKNNQLYEESIKNDWGGFNFHTLLKNKLVGNYRQALY